MKTVNNPVHNVLMYIIICNAVYKPSDLIGHTTFQNLEQLVVHDVTRPSLRVAHIGV